MPSRGGLTHWYRAALRGFTSGRSPRALVAAIVLAATLLAQQPAFAAVLDADYVGGVQVGKNATLRATAPDLYIPSGVLTTVDGRQLWARDPDSRRAMASTTKIMTAVVVLENASLDATATVDKQAATVGQSVMGLVRGETLTVRSLLQGLLIQSGNDAATLLAEKVGGSVDGFVKMMNAKAAALDLTNTHYLNPHGLDVPGHYTSANDLTSLARYAMHNATFRADVSTYRTKVYSDKYVHIVTNHNSLLQTYPGTEGIKTGWTGQAGYCVVAAAQRDGVELIATVLGAQTDAGRSQQAKKLLDWGFSHYRVTGLATAGEQLGRVPVSDYMERTVGATVAEATSAPVFDIAGPVKHRIELRRDVPAPVKAGDNVGTLTVYQGKTVICQIPLVADRDVPVPSVWQRIVFFFGKLWRGIVG